LARGEPEEVIIELMADQTPLEQFKSVLTGTARALAHEAEIELAFTADVPTQAGKNFKVPMPGRLLPPEREVLPIVLR
jgi:cobaltochelatase CobT